MRGEEHTSPMDEGKFVFAHKPKRLQPPHTSSACTHHHAAAATGARPLCAGCWPPGQAPHRPALRGGQHAAQAGVWPCVVCGWLDDDWERFGGRGRRHSLAPSSACVCAHCRPLPSQFKAVKPVGDRVFVKVDKERPRSVGGVLLPAVSQASSTGGTVVEVGDVHMVKVGGRAGWCGSSRGGTLHATTRMAHPIPHPILASCVHTPHRPGTTSCTPSTRAPTSSWGTTSMCC